MTYLPAPQQLRYLVTLAETQHFGRAASACAVTQSTLSAGLIALERQLDAAILDRSLGKRVAFTPLGLEIIARARTALASLETIAEAATAAREPMSGPLRLGVIPTIGAFLLPRLMPALREAFPNLRLYLHEDTTNRCLERLASNRLDLVLLALPCDCAGADTMAVARDEFVVALPPGSPLAELDRISPRQLTQERMLLLEEGHCLRDQALSVCPPARAEAPDGYAATSLHTLVQMVAGGLGITLLPRLAVEAGVTTGTDVTLRPLSGRGAWRTIGLAWRPTAPREADFRALAAVLAGAFGEVG
jgi:LysR family transcriptional regulator, hydrogen peroxide-inducible genes activator